MAGQGGQLPLALTDHAAGEQQCLGPSQQPGPLCHLAGPTALLLHDGDASPDRAAGLLCTLQTSSAGSSGQPDYFLTNFSAQVPAIITVLRTQAQFNTLISSCVRTNSLEDVDTSMMMEVTCLDPLCKALSITFEHPTEEVIATAELHLSDVSSPRCRVYSSSVALCPEETADRVLQVLL